MIELEMTKANLESLGLTVAAKYLDAFLERAQGENYTYLSFLNELLEAEVAERQRRNIEVRSKLSRLPHKKTLQEFDFNFQPGVDEKLVKELATMAFVHRAENVVLLGPPGVGKTHLAVGLSMEALSRGISVYFTTLMRMVEDLKRAYENQSLMKRMKVYSSTKLLVTDEVGYLPLDSLGSSLFFPTDKRTLRKGEHHSYKQQGIWRMGRAAG